MSGSLARLPALLDETLTLNEHDLAEWGRGAGAILQAPCIIALSGELGAGKTALVRAICEGYGVTGAVTSPTFALIHRYLSARSPVLHIDLYRLSTERECAQLGLEELLESNCLILIEWAERAAQLLPPNTIWLKLEYLPSDSALRILRPGR